MAINVPKIQGDWNHLCALARQRWTQLTENDLRVPEGDVEALLDRIQQVTCDKREAIEKYFLEMTSRGSSAVAHAADAAGRYAQQESGRIRERDDFAEGLVRRNSMQTLATALGIGLVAGLIIGLTIRTR